MTATLHIDFETRSIVDLKKSGMYAYAENPATGIWMACWALGEGPVQTWWPGEPIPFLIKRHIITMGKFVAHNAGFERCIWRCILTPRYGWPESAVEQWDCTAARAAAMALPRDLGRAAIACGLDVNKDMSGRRLMLQMSKPRKIEGGHCSWWDQDEKKKRLEAYCKIDVEVERALDKVVRPLNETEREIWLHDQIVNERGMYIDRKAINDASIILRKATALLNDELAALTGNVLCSLTQAKEITAWLQRNGVDTNSIDKPSIIRMLKQEIPPRVRRVLEIRQLGAKSSTAKLAAFTDRCSTDGRIRDNFMYHAASTGRAGGRGVQTQNMTRPNLTPEQIEHAISLFCYRDPEVLDIHYGPAIGVISDCLRGMICAPEGHNLISSDLANIESRVLAWEVNDYKKLKIFSDYDAGQGPDIYKVAAAQVFGIPATEIGKGDPRRQVGKTTELALGFQGGVGALQQMARTYQTTMAPAFDSLWARMTMDERPQLEEKYTKYEKNFRPTDKIPDMLPRTEWLASEIAKILWRRANPLIVQYWYDLENAAMIAVRSQGDIIPCGKVKFRWHGNVLWLQLPSKRCLAYMDPKIREVDTPWGDKKESVTFMGVDSNSASKQWVRQKSYGGMWCENITQAIARDVLFEAMLRLEALGYPIVQHAHDEAVALIPEGFGSQEEFDKELTKQPGWSDGNLPLAAEGWTGKRYRK